MANRFKGSNGRSRGFTMVDLLAVIFIICFLTGVVFSAGGLMKARETANRVKCGSNMRQIGQGILLYANENKGKYPPDLGILVKTEDLTPEVFICPTGNNGFPRGANLAIDDQVKWVNEHSDYIYVGAGMNATAGAETIVLYEKPDAHQRQGMNILYGDGHVEFQMMAAAMQEIERQKANRKGGGR